MQAIVITGASTGIGRACALALDALGFDVFAGIRREQDGEALRQAGSERLTPVHLDVTQAESIAAVRALVEERLDDGGRFAGLVNNAGTTVPCPVEFLPLEEFRRQLEVNLVGHLAVTQAFLPLLFRDRGRIVNVSSAGGKVGPPLMATYAAAKHGLEGLSDSLRIELGWSGVHVSVIEPGAIATPMGGKLIRDTETWLSGLPAAGREKYGAALQAMATGVSGSAAKGSDPDVVARAVVHALTSRRPRSRYPVGSGAKPMIFMRRILPDRWMDRMLVSALGLTKQ
ncbi:SDR family NAD(P)-dependent oxidoreductase [Flindersiella endophytica]